MKLFYIFILSAICQLTMAQTAEDKLVTLINKQDYLALSREYVLLKDSVQHDVVKLLSEAYIGAANNKLQESSDAINILMSNHQADIGMDGIIASIVLLAKNMNYQGNYKKSSDMIQSFLDQTANFEGWDGPFRKELEKLTHWGVLGDDMKPEIIRPDKDCEIPFFYGEGRLDNMPYINAELNGNTVSFVFDTGADANGTNTVSEAFAHKNGIRILEDSVVISGMSEGYVKLGIADSMQIGNIIYKNVAFTIAPGDNLLPVDTIFMDAVLGSVFMKAVKEVQIYPQEKRIVFPFGESELLIGGSNMTLASGQAYVEAFSNSERLLLHFDTGAGIGLSSKYYMKHKERIEETARLDTTGGIGGFGAMKRINRYILPDFPLEIAAQKRNIEDIAILTETGLGLDIIVDGSIGFDFLKLFDKVTFNFNQMFLKLE